MHDLSYSVSKAHLLAQVARSGGKEQMLGYGKAGTSCTRCFCVTTRVLLRRERLFSTAWISGRSVQVIMYIRCLIHVLCMKISATLTHLGWWCHVILA